jgi:hypothetical protein
MGTIVRWDDLCSIFDKHASFLPSSAKKAMAISSLCMRKGGEGAVELRYEADRGNSKTRRKLLF